MNEYARKDALRDACLELYHALDENVVKPCLTVATLALDLHLMSIWSLLGVKKELDLTNYV